MSDFTHIPGTELTPSGLDWQPAAGFAVTEDVRYSDITSWVGGFVVVEWSRQFPNGLREAAILRSADGRTWESSPLPARFKRIWRLFPFKGGLVLATQRRGHRDDSFLVDIWRSRDGAAWRRAGSVHARLPAGLGIGWHIGATVLVAARGHLALIARVTYATGAGGWTPVGPRLASVDWLAAHRPTPRDRLLGWTSRDGATWVRRPVTGVLDRKGSGYIDLAMSTPDGTRAIRVGGRYAILTSRDGLNWRDIAPLARDYEWGGNQGLLWAGGALELISDSGKEEGREACGNRLGIWRLRVDRRWEEVLDRQPAFVNGSDAVGPTVALVGRSWCLGGEVDTDAWAWIMVSTDGGRTWDPDLAWVGAVGTCLGDVAIHHRTVVVLGCAWNPPTTALDVPAIWTADLPASSE